MKENFNQSLAYILQSEGLWSDRPTDPGGATMKGITFEVFRRFKRNPYLTKQDLLHISDQDVHDIYKQLYWDKVHGDELPIGIDYAIFDCAVNSGCATASKLLQEAVGVTADGVIGNQTLQAVQKANIRSLLENYYAERTAYYQSLPTFGEYGNGWINRVNDVKKRINLMLG